MVIILFIGIMQQMPRATLLEFQMKRRVPSMHLPAFRLRLLCVPNMKMTRQPGQFMLLH